MKRFITTLAALLVALPAAAANVWTSSGPDTVAGNKFNQSFTLTFDATGYSTANIDLSECVAPTVTISSINAAAEILDCPASDSDRSECVSKISVPNPRGMAPGAGPHPVATFQKGFAMVRVTDATPTGTVTVTCNGNPGKFYSKTAAAWVEAKEVRHQKLVFYNFDTSTAADSDKCAGTYVVAAQDCTLSGSTSYFVPYTGQPYINKATCSTNARTTAGATQTLTLRPYYHDGDAATDVPGGDSLTLIDMENVTDGDIYEFEFNERAPLVSGTVSIQATGSGANTSTLDLVCDLELIY